MKRTMRIAAIALSLILAFGTICSFGTVDKSTGYGYTVTFYAGLQGHFGSDKDNKTVTKECKAGEEITISLADLDFHLDNNEYYAKGLRQTGHDNDEYKDINSKTITVDEDMAFEVAYGIKGGMVAYTVNYVSAKGGKVLHDSDTYYGMVGDKPVVSYKYVENYLPDAYNKGKTLSADESLNVYTFTYSYTGKSGNGGDNDDNDNNGNNNNGNNGNNNGANNGAANANAPGGNAAANADGTNIADNDTPQAAPNDFVDLDDPDAPLADGSDQEDKDSGSKLPFLIGGGIGALLLACIAYALARRRREE